MIYVCNGRLWFTFDAGGSMITNHTSDTNAHSSSLDFDTFVFCTKIN